MKEYKIIGNTKLNKSKRLNNLNILIKEIGHQDRKCFQFNNFKHNIEGIYLPASQQLITYEKKEKRGFANRINTHGDQFVHDVSLRMIAYNTLEHIKAINKQIGIETEDMKEQKILEKELINQNLFDKYKLKNLKGGDFAIAHLEYILKK